MSRYTKEIDIPEGRISLDECVNYLRETFKDINEEEIRDGIIGYKGEIPLIHYEKDEEDRLVGYNAYIEVTNDQIGNNINNDFTHKYIDEYDDRYDDDDEDIEDEEYINEKWNSTYGDEVISLMFTSPWEEIESEINEAICIDNNVRKYLNNEYIRDFSKRTEYPYLLIESPELEQLSKAGYKFADDILFTGFYPNEYNILVNKRGKSPKDILNVAPIIRTALKENKNISFWLILNKLSIYGLTDNDIKFIMDNKFNDIDILNYLLSILSIEKISVKKLLYYIKMVMDNVNIDISNIRYKRNLKRYIIELRDAIYFAQDLRIRFDYKRYDISNYHNELMNLNTRIHDENTKLGIKNFSSMLKNTIYQNKEFIIRPIRDYSELIHEADEMKNCLADGGYADAMASGNSYIYLMRKVKNPNKSYISVQIDNDFNIMQAFRACNEPISAKEENFLTDWSELMKKKNKIR